MTKPFDLKKRTLHFAIDVVHFTNDLKSKNNEFVLSRQLMRSGTAVGALIREAQNGESHKDFIHKMAVSQKECDESTYWLELIELTDFKFDKQKLMELKTESQQLLKIIRTIILNKKRNTEIR